MSERDQRIQKLFETAHKDQHLKMRLLDDPEDVAKEWGVELECEEIDRLKKLGGLVEMTNEAKIGRLFRCDPRVCYPVTLWHKESLIEFLNVLVRDIRVIKDNLIFYPAPEIMKQVQDRLDRTLGHIK